jgi:hypothetical protein
MISSSLQPLSASSIPFCCTPSCRTTIDLGFLLRTESTEYMTRAFSQPRILPSVRSSLLSKLLDHSATPRSVINLETTTPVEAIHQASVNSYPLNPQPKTCKLQYDLLRPVLTLPLLSNANAKCPMRETFALFTFYFDNHALLYCSSPGPFRGTRVKHAKDISSPENLIKFVYRRRPWLCMSNVFALLPSVSLAFLTTGSA